MYDMSLEEWIECEEYYNEIDNIIDEEMAMALDDDDFLEWCESRNYESFEEICEWYDALGF